MNMKRKKISLAVALTCLIFLSSGYSTSNQSSATINKISVRPEELSTKIFLETTASPMISKTYYLREAPSTVAIELKNINTAQEPQIVQDKDALVESIKLEKIGEDKGLLLVGLKEKVPYRIFSNTNYTVLELNKIQRTMDGYMLTSDTQQRLKARSKREIVFKEVNISEEKDKIHVKARLSDGPVTQVFALDNPLRLVVDFFDALYLDPTFLYPVKNLGIERVRTGQFQLLSPYTIARMVFDLSEPRCYTIAADKDEFVFSFYKNDIAQAPPIISKPVPMPSAAPTLPPVKEPETKPVEAAKEEVAPKVEIPLEKPPEKIVEKPVEPPPALPKRNQVAPIQEPVTENQFKPRTIADTGEIYTGELINLKLKDADIRDVVLYLGHQFGLNVVFDPEVKGTPVTCDLINIPWDQALDIILKQHKLGKTMEGNVLRIAPMSVLTREEEEQRKFRESKELAQPVVVKTFVLSYAKVKDIEGLLKTKISKRGSMIIDERTNTMVVEDVRDRLDLMEKLLSLFDAPNPQVSIEARIIEATSNFARNLGIQWGFRGVLDPFYGNQTNLKFPNKILVDGALIPEGVQTKGISGPLGGYAINLPAPAFNTALGLSFGNVMDTFRLDVALSALESSGEGRIISTPSVTTQNYKQAEIIQGQQIPVQTTANFTTTTRYQNAALELRATPQITAEGTIIMDIEIRNNAPDFGRLVNGIPPITTQSATTRVMVPDGGTAVIGGIFRTEDSISRENVPFLHKIPILGSLFRSLSRTKTNRELIIFITPRIIK